MIWKFLSKVFIRWIEIGIKILDNKRRGNKSKSLLENFLDIIILEMRLLFWKLDLIVIYWIYFYNRKFVNLLGQVIWYHDDQPVKESADFQLLFQGDKCSLVIHEAFLDDAGVYKVVAINSGGEASSQCTLTVTRKSNHWIFRYLINVKIIFAAIVLTIL